MSTPAHVPSAVIAAIVRLEPLAKHNHRELIQLFLAPAVRALPDQSQHHSTLASVASVFQDVDSARACESVARAARDVFMYAVSTYATTGEILVRVMIECGSSATLASACGEAWSIGGERALKVVQGSAFGVPQTLSDVQWELRVPLTSSSASNVVACLDLELSEQKPSGRPTRESFNVEFSQEELVNFFGKIDQIQSQLDALV